MDKQNTRSGNTDNLAESWQQRSTTFGDGIIIFVIVIVIYLLGYAFNLFDLLDNWFDNVKPSHIDELLLLLILGFVIFTVRRWRELKIEMTERMRSEEVLRQQARIIDQIHDSVVSTDIDGYVTSWNKGAERLFGYSVEEAQGRHISFVYPQDQHHFLQQEVITPLKQKGDHEVEVYMQKKSGEDFYAHLSLSLLKDKTGTSTGMIGYSMDITERKRTEEALRESEELFRQLAENIREVFFIRDVEQNQMIYVSPTYEKVWQQARENLYKNPKAFLGSVVEEDYDRVSAALEKQGQGIFFSDEYRIMWPDGTIRWVWARTFPIKNDVGTIYRLAGIVEDITERKQSNQVLRENEKRFRALIENIGDMIAVSDAEGMLVYVSPSTHRVVGYTEVELLGRNAFELVHPENLEYATNLFTELVQRPGEAITTTLRILHKDGSARWVEATITNLLAEPSVKGVVGNYRDITERKLAREAMQQSEERLRAFANALPDLAFILDGDGRHVEVLTGQKSLLLTPSAQLKDRLLHEVLPTKEADKLLGLVQRTIETNQPQSLEYILDVPAGQRWFEGRTSPIPDIAGIGRMVALVSRDITERKQADEALRKSEQQFRSLAENLPDIIARFDRQLRHIYINQQIETPTRMKPGEFLGKSNRELGMPLALVNSWDQALLEVSESGQLKVIEFRFPTPKGKFTYYETRLVPEIASDGSVDTILTISRDITERKQAESELKRQKERLQKIVDNIPTLLVFISPDGQTEWVNREWQKVLGWSLEEARSRDLLVEMYPDPDERQEVLDFAMNPPPSGWRDFRIRTKDGRVLDTTWANVLLAGGSGIGIGQDITERKAMERELQASERRFRQIFARAPISIWEEDFSAVGDWLAELRARGVHDLDAFLQAEPQALEQALGLVRLVDVNDTTLQLFEANSKEELLNLWTSLFTDDTFDVFAEELRAIWEGRNQVDFECSARTTVRGRPIHYLLHWVAPLEDGQMNLRRVIVAIADITERKLAEEEIRRQVMRAETLTRIAARLNKQLKLDIVIHAVCEEALDTFNVSQTAMSLYDKKSDLLVYAGGINIPPEDIAIMEPINRARFDEFVRTIGPTFVIPDVQSLQDVPNVELHARQDMRTVVISTMLWGQELIGTVTLGVTGHIREFNKDELALLKAISDQAAQAIANARLFEQVQGARRRLKTLSRRLLEVQETERHQIALELHDQLGQNLTAIKLNLQAAQRTTQPSALASILEENIATVERALDRVRNISLDLRPSMLDDLGLVAALRWYIDRLARQADLAITFTAEGVETRPASTLETTCFRVAQEALTNVIRHAQAQQVQVELWQQEADLNLLIRDDGRGFDVTAALEQAAHGASVGLLGMQERVKLADGWLEIESSGGYGTEILVRLPLIKAGRDKL